MMKSIYNAMLEWNQTSNERQKLQHVYVVLTILSVLTAGVVSLIDNETGQQILMLTLLAGIIFVVNGVIWNLLDSIVVGKLSGRRKRQ